MREAGIGVNVHYIPVHLQPYYQVRGFKMGDFPVAESYYDEAISLPLFPGLSADNQAKIVASLKKFLD
jgi:dTDP-4-amino-4,6-dideoxygalactose transaminase